MSAAKAMGQRPDRLGVLMTPRAGNRIGWANVLGVPWAADNDCFQGLHGPRWLRFLARLTESDSKPLWVACPDVVADAGETWTMFFRWQPVLESLGLPVALVAQDGLERLKWRGPLQSTWDKIACLFIGGSTEWKMSEHVDRLIAEAKANGKLVHIGRVNSLRRIRHFTAVGADSFDGTGFSAFGDKRIRLAVKWIDKATGCRDLLTMAARSAAL